MKLTWMLVEALARQVTDSRDFSFLQIGTIGGDLGGIFDGTK
jgi:hypothetical protein